MKKLLLLVFVLFNLSLTTKAESSSNSNFEVLKTINTIVSEICLSPSTEGKYWRLDTDGRVGAKISIFGEVEGNINLTQEEWNGIRNLKSEDQVNRENSYRVCVQYMTPLLLERLVKSSKEATGPRGCKQDDYDKVQSLAYFFAQQYIDQNYDGGQDIISNINSCNYNSYSREYQADLNITWNGMILRSNHYEINGRLNINTNGRYEFSRSYANQKLKNYEIMKNIVIMTIISGSLLEDYQKR
ncbi:hypothetical protein [Thiofilum flexile]|uniref:hypothetical protein n=1 Tax=Thiofilum flexile TaxID=125627 RepID=UPI000375BE25|nr:hypothetical protein [Thiofilum flexile]